MSRNLPTTTRAIRSEDDPFRARPSGSQQVVPPHGPHHLTNFDGDVQGRPDGRAPEAHLLQLLDGSVLVKNEGDSFPNHPAIPHNGIIEFTGYAERTYDLSVRFWVDDLGGPVPHDRQRIARSEVVRLPPGKGPASVKLVLTRTFLADEDR